MPPIRDSKVKRPNDDPFRVICLGESFKLDEIEFPILSINAAAQIYTCTDRFLDMLDSIVDEHVFIVVTNLLAPQVLHLIYNRPQIVKIYIIDDDDQWVKIDEKYLQIVEFVCGFDNVISLLDKEVHQSDRMTMIFNIFDQKQKSTRDLTKESALFLWHQMIIHVLKRMPRDETTMHEMLKLCSDYYQTNEKELEKIEQFKSNYTSDQAIQWYTDECFLYRLVNQALRTEDIELLYKFRFFIIDLCTELEKRSKQLRTQDDLRLFRGQMMHIDEIVKLEKNIGQFISTNGFFSTSKNAEISRSFLKKSSGTLVRVLFEIDVNFKSNSTVCADISSSGSMPWEEEVLFSLNTVFQITNVKFDESLDLWKVKLVTTDEGINQVNHYVRWLEDEIDQSSPLVYFGRLLWSELGQISQAQKYLQMLLDSLPTDHSDRPSIHLELGQVYDETGDHVQALKNTEIALRLREALNPIEPNRLAAALNGMGIIYLHKADTDRAIDYFTQSLSFYENESNKSKKNLHHSNTLSNLASAHSQKKNYDLALDYFNRSYEMRKELLPVDHPRLADTFSNLGSIHHLRENLDQALDFYKRAYDIQTKTCPTAHLGRANTLRNLGLIYRDKEEFNKAIDHLNQALQMRKDLLNSPHSSIAICYGDIGKVHEKMNAFNLALEFYQKQLKMEEDCLPVDHPNLGLHFDWIINAMKRNGQIEKALVDCNKKLESLPGLLGDQYSTHPRYAHALISLGTVLEDSDYSKSYEHYQQALKILQSHQNLEAYENCLTSMVNLLWRKNQHDEALIHQQKLVDLHKRTLSPMNKNLALSLRGLARLYRTVKNYDQALDYFNQSLTIFRKIFGDGHQLSKETSDEIEQVKRMNDQVENAGFQEEILEAPMEERTFRSEPDIRHGKSAACIIL